MKIKDQYKEIKELTIAELNEKIEKEQVELNKMKMNHAISPLESPVQIRNKRKMIAQLLTEKRSRELNNVQ